MPYYTSLWQKSAPINHYAPRLRILLPCRQFIFAVADGGPPLPYHPSYPAPQHRSPHRRRRLLPELLLLSWESCYSCLDDLCVFYTEKTEAKRYKTASVPATWVASSAPQQVLLSSPYLRELYLGSRPTTMPLFSLAVWPPSFCNPPMGGLCCMVKIITPIYHSATHLRCEGKSPTLQYLSPIGRKPGGGRQQPAVTHMQPLRIPNKLLPLATVCTGGCIWRGFLTRLRSSIVLPGWACP